MAGARPGADEGEGPGLGGGGVGRVALGGGEERAEEGVAALVRVDVRGDDGVDAAVRPLERDGPDGHARVRPREGGVRRERDEARIIDLDLLDYDSYLNYSDNNGLAKLPHPRLELRAFVLLPLAELDPGWRHPVSQKSLAMLIAGLPRDQQIAPISD